MKSEFKPEEEIKEAVVKYRGRGGYRGGHRPKTLAAGARRHSIWATEEEFAAVKVFLVSYRLKAKEAAEC